MRLLSHILQVLHVCTHQHAPQQQEVRVNWILHWHVQRQHAWMNSWTGCKNAPRQRSSEYLLLYPRDRSDLWPFFLCSPPERYSQWLQTGYCPAKREAAKWCHHPRKRRRVGRSNLQYLVVFLKVFVVFVVRLGKLVDVDPKPSDFLFDLPHTNASARLYDLNGKHGRGSLSLRAYLLLLSAHLCGGQAVSFGQHRHYIDFSMQGLHALHVQRSEAATHTSVR